MDGTFDFGASAQPPVVDRHEHHTLGKVTVRRVQMVLALAFATLMLAPWMILR